MSAANQTANPTPTQPTARRRGRPRRPPKIYRVVRNLGLAFVLLAVIMVAVILGIDNQTPVSVRFLNRVSPQWPMFWWLCAAFGGGMLLGLTLCAGSLMRGRFRQRLLRRSLQQRQTEIDRIRDSRE